MLTDLMTDVPMGIDNAKLIGHMFTQLIIFAGPALISLAYFTRRFALENEKDFRGIEDWKSYSTESRDTLGIPTPPTDDSEVSGTDQKAA